jgi:glycosyltransferase involved in cell wall biosynthesis
MNAKPIRVCHVMTADLWAGAEVQVATLASYLAARADVQVSAVLFNEGWLASELRALGITVAVVDEHRCTPFAIVRFLTRFFRRHQIEVIHTHRYKDNILGSIAAACRRSHVIRTVHGRSEPLRGWDWLKFQIYQSLDLAALWSRADRVVAVSSRMVAALKASGYRAGTLTHVHNGIDLRKVHTTGSVANTREAIGLNAETWYRHRRQTLAGERARVPRSRGGTNRSAGTTRAIPVRRQRSARGAPARSRP